MSEQKEIKLDVDKVIQKLAEKNSQLVVQVSVLETQVQQLQELVKQQAEEPSFDPPQGEAVAS